MNLPNKLTVIRILLAPIFLLLLLWEFPFHNLTAGLVFGAAALTDMFDGKIARSRGLITNLGKFLDPLADKMLTTAAFLGFLAAGRLDVWAVMIILTREFMVTSVRLVAAKDGTVIAASLAGQGQDGGSVRVHPLHAGGAGVLQLGAHASGRNGGAGLAVRRAAPGGAGAHLGVGGADRDFRVPVRLVVPAIFHQRRLNGK